MPGRWDDKPTHEQSVARPSNARFERWKAKNGITEDANGNLVSRGLVGALWRVSLVSLGSGLIVSVAALLVDAKAGRDDADVRAVALFGLLIVAANAGYHLWRHRSSAVRAINANRRTGFASAFAGLLVTDLLAVCVPVAAALYLVRTGA